MFKAALIGLLLATPALAQQERIIITPEGTALMTVEPDGTIVIHRNKVTKEPWEARMDKSLDERIGRRTRSTNPFEYRYGHGE